MQIFEFGPRRPDRNYKGDLVYSSDIRLHIQCRWRFIDQHSILFARDDLHYPADESIPSDEFDWDTDQSRLDEIQLKWFKSHQPSMPIVKEVHGDRYGGFRIVLSGGFVLEGIPCDSRRGEYSEHWRLLGHRGEDSHFVITGDGVELTGSA